MEVEKQELQRKWAKNQKEENEKQKRQLVLNQKLAEEVKRYNLVQKMEKEEA